MSKQALLNKLVKTKQRIIRPLLFFTIAPYFTFIFVIAFYPQYFSNLILDSSVSTGIILGLLLIILIWVITILYVYLTNKHVEPIIQEIDSA